MHCPRYLDILEKHLRSSVLDKLPNGYTSLIKQVDSNDELDMSILKLSDRYAVNIGVLRFVRLLVL